MDIMRPNIEEEAAPDPWRLARNRARIGPMIQAMIQKNPERTADEIVGELARRGIRVSGIVVAGELMKFRNRTAKREPSASGR